MDKQLHLPFKTTVPLPTLPTSLRNYIATHFKDISPEAFNHDIAQFARLRTNAVETPIEVHRESVGGLVKYHANVAYLLSKLPPDINQTFPYLPPFPPPYTLHTPPPVQLPTLAHERFAVLYNLAACHANLGSEESRSTSDSLKRAIAALSTAAAIFTYLLVDLLPTLPSLDSFGAAVYDFKAGYVETMARLCEAMAQECFWQSAVLDKYKNGIIAKLAIKVSELYDQALIASQKDQPAASTYLPAAWTALMNVKKLHFSAAAQYRMSVEDLEKNRYGQEISRLEIAQGLAKKAMDFAKKGHVTDGVLNDIKTMQSTLSTNLTRARRDNDLIYLALVPPAGELPSISGVMLVKPTLPAEIKDSLSWLMKEGGGLGWEGLVDYGVHVAISVYDDRKDTFVREEIVGRKTEIDGIVASTLQSLNLPASLQAIERPIGLPPSLLGMAEEVRRQGGAGKIRRMLDDVASLRQGADGILNEAFDTLDQEAEEDESFRNQYGSSASRPASHEVNGDFIAMGSSHRQTLEQAGASDRVVKNKWEEWEDRVEVLGGDEESLISSIPRLPSGPSLSSNPITRLLHTLLESLTDLSTARQRLVDQAKHLSSTDDIRSRIISEANSIQRSSGASAVQTSWFEGLFEKELAKYEGLKREMEEKGQEAERVLEELGVQNEAFVQGRRTSPTIKAREKALMDMEVAYRMYSEIVTNLQDGIKFYSDFTTLLSRYRDSCKNFVWSRRSDVANITASLSQTSLSSQPPPQQQQQQQQLSSPPRIQQSYQSQPQSSYHQLPPAPSPQQQPPRFPSPPPQHLSHAQTHHYQPSPPSSSTPYFPPPPVPPLQQPRQPPKQGQFFLPPPNSSAWETQELPPPPGHAPWPLASNASSTPAKKGRQQEEQEVMTPRRSERRRAGGGVV